jgi:hypothetical protein
MQANNGLSKRIQKRPSAPTYQFKPFSHHIDGGFGAVGDAFHEAASRLEITVIDTKFLHSSLPIAYLYRHAAELFLKSCIIVLHRRLQIPFGGEKQDAPAIKNKDNWMPIHNVHSLAKLYRYFSILLREHTESLSKLTSTKWDSFPQELAQWISQIEEFDARSTFFRYPDTANGIKSDFREFSVEEIRHFKVPAKSATKIFVEFDEKDDLPVAFCLDPSRLEPLMDTLRKTSETLSTLHFALRCELGSGS